MSSRNSRKSNKTSRAGCYDTIEKNGNKYVRMNGMSLCIPAPKVYKPKPKQVVKRKWYQRVIDLIKGLV